MTHLLSTRQNIHNNSYPTLTPLTPTYNSQPNPQTNTALFPFWDTLISQASNGTLITKVYRKPTHTDQYLHWDSHHNITKNTASTIHSHIRSVCLLQPTVIGTNKTNTSIWHSISATTLTEFSTSSKQNGLSESFRNICRKSRSTGSF